MFNALTASALQATPPAPFATTATFSPFDPSRQPNRKDILNLRSSCLALARDLATDGTQWGYTGLVVTGADWDRITTNAPAYQIPVHPGPNAAAGANQLTAYQNEEFHKRQLKAFADYRNAHTIIKSAVLAVVPKQFLETLADPESYFAGVTALQMFEHLLDTYGTVTRDNLDGNEADLHSQWDPDSQPIETLWMQGTKAQNYAPAPDAITDNFILRSFVRNVKNTNKFDSTLKKFEELPVLQQTLAQFKTDMQRSYKVWASKNLRATAAATGYSSANLAQTPAPAPPAPTTFSRYAFKVGNKNFCYCWSHGLSPIHNTTEHNSSTCNNRREGHQEQATFDNQMGGSNPCRIPRIMRRPAPPQAPSDS